MTHQAESFTIFEPFVLDPTNPNFSAIEKEYIGDIAPSVDVALRDIETMARDLPADDDGRTALSEHLRPENAATSVPIGEKAQASWRHSMPVVVEHELWRNSPAPRIRTEIFARDAQLTTDKPELYNAILSLNSNLRRYAADETLGDAYQPLTSPQRQLLGVMGEPTSEGYTYETPIIRRHLRERVVADILSRTPLLKAQITLALPFSEYGTRPVLSELNLALTPEGQGQVSDAEVATRRRVVAMLLSKSTPIADRVW